jgi:hypothetical protein
MIRTTLVLCTMPRLEIRRRQTTCEMYDCDAHPRRRAVLARVPR